MKRLEMNLNIRYDAPDEVWEKVPLIYAQLNGWLGYGKGGDQGNPGIPYWFGYAENAKHIWASVEPAGLHFSALMEEHEWETWIQRIKEIATRELGYKIGEIEKGEVGH